MTRTLVTIRYRAVRSGAWTRAALERYAAQVRAELETVPGVGSAAASAWTPSHGEMQLQVACVYEPGPAYAVPAGLTAAHGAVRAATLVLGDRAPELDDRNITWVRAERMETDVLAEVTTAGA